MQQEKQASVMDGSVPSAEPGVVGALHREEDAASLPQRDVEVPPPLPHW